MSKKEGVKVERAIAAFFIGFSMIGMASFIFIFGVIIGKDVETTVTFKVAQPDTVVEAVSEDTTTDPIEAANDAIESAVEEVKDAVEEAEAEAE